MSRFKGDSVQKNRFFEIFLFQISSSPNSKFFLKFLFFLEIFVVIYVLYAFLAYFKGVFTAFLLEVDSLFISM